MSQQFFAVEQQTGFGEGNVLEDEDEGSECSKTG